MATVTLDPMFQTLKNKAGNFVYYPRWGNTYSRQYVKPRNPDTESQRKNRNLFREAMKSWQALTVEEKQKYVRKAGRLPMTGHNLYISQYMKKHLAVEREQSAGAESNKVQFRYNSSFTRKAVRSVASPSMKSDCLYSPSLKVLHPPG